MDAFVFAAVLAAAAMHAGWNAVLKLRLDPFLTAVLIAIAAGIIAAPVLVWTGWPRHESWPWLLASLIFHFGYYIGLTEAYRRADMSQVYPIARGTAPLMTSLVALLALAEPIGPSAAFGIATLGGGILLMSLKGGHGAGFNPGAVAFALFTAVMICGYTLADGIGARAAGDPHAYAAALFLLDAVPVLLLAFWRFSIAELRQALRFAGPGLAGGAMSLGAYWTAIWAMTVAPIPLVAAVRESSVLFGILIAVVILKEPLRGLRVASACLIVAGLALIRLQ